MEVIYLNVQIFQIDENQYRIVTLKALEDHYYKKITVQIEDEG
jgi:hypothetical protein